MKIWYEFTNGEVSEIEVDEALGGLLVEFDRQEYNNDHKETRRHVSLNGLDYEGRCLLRPTIRRRKCCGGSAAAGGRGPAHAGYGGPVPLPAGAGVKSLL